MMKPPLPRRWPLYLLVSLCLLTAVTAFRSAVSWYGHPVPGIFLDPDGVVSNLGLPDWDSRRSGLSFPDRVLAVDGKPLVSKAGAPRARVWDDTVERAFGERRSAIEATLQTRTGVRTVRLAVQALEPLAWWIYAGSLLFAAVLYATGSLVALWVNPRSPLARTFAKLCLSTSFLLGLMFDFHTTRVLAPLFFAAFSMAPVSLAMLALRLPDDAPVLKRMPWLERFTDVVGLAIAGSLVFLYESGRATLGLQQLCSVALVGSLLFFGTTFVIRFVRSRGIRRSRLRALLVSVVPSHLVTWAIFFHIPRGSLAEALFFATLSLFPIATAFAFIRYDLWGSGTILSRILTRLGVGALACIVSIGVGTALATGVGARFTDALLAAAAGGMAAAVLVVTALAGLDRYLFAARAKYKPTVDELSAELVSINSPGEVARAVERTIGRWLPCERIALSLTEPTVTPGTLESGAHVISTETRDQGGDITLPVEFGGVRLGSLRVGEKPGHALFTQDEVDLLHTIVNQGALALAHAYAYRELEQRRREQAAAWRGERAALLETLGAEIAHEIRYPINFFRSVFEGTGGELDADAVSIGREEVDRLERLVAGLKRMASHRIERRGISLIELCGRVETLLRDALADRKLQLAIPEQVQIACDPDQMIQILVNLVSNGLQAAGESGTVGVAWSQSATDAELVVWDTGPGFKGDGARLFAPWYTTKPGGTGLGLAITHRLVRAHGWNITAQRRDNRTMFVIRVRAEDVLLRDGGTGGAVQSPKVAQA